jgi:putative addiction module component (TIGR02574 family)
VTIEDFPIEDFSPEERLELIGKLWDSLESRHGELGVSDWHRAEIDRRCEEADRTPEAGIPWEVVKARLFPSR